MPTFKLRWTMEDPSEALILTYSSSWKQEILQRAFSVEFRKSGPMNLDPEWVYAYVTAPVAAIVARMPVKDFGHIAVKQAFALVKHALFNEVELEKYAGTMGDLYFYRFGPIQVAKQPITYKVLSSEYGYHTSSNFFPLSEYGRQTLDSLGEAWE